VSSVEDNEEMRAETKDEKRTVGVGRSWKLVDVARGHNVPFHHGPPCPAPNSDSESEHTLEGYLEASKLVPCHGR
jgi:hypothetical protein